LPGKFRALLQRLYDYLKELDKQVDETDTKIQQWHRESQRSRRLVEIPGIGPITKVEHPFHVVKNLFKHRKTCYRGLAKNTAQLLTLFGMANLMLAKKRLIAIHAQGAS
jgi:IS5 family transposase